jgi:phosphatidylinositol dimannoside acyltransferase
VSLLTTNGRRDLALYRFASFLAATLPPWLTRRGAEVIAETLAHTTGFDERRHLVAGHLRRVYGPGLPDADLDQRVAETFASYGRYWAESLRLPSLTPTQVHAGMSSDGFDDLFRARALGRGVILALPHLGGWEWGGTWLAQQGIPVSVVVEALEPPAVFDWFVDFRRSLGLEVIAVGPGAGTASVRALNANRVLCLLCDRVVGDTPGVEVDFFGETTTLPAGPLTLGHRTGAPVLPAAVYFAPGRPDHLAVVRPPVSLERTGRLRRDIEIGTQALASELEHLIRRAPTQWHLMQPNWPSDRQAMAHTPR